MNLISEGFQMTAQHSLARSFSWVHGNKLHSRTLVAAVLTSLLYLVQASPAVGQAGLTVNSPPQITQLVPADGAAGQTLSVTITGQDTNFVQGVTQVSFGPFISVGGAAEGASGLVTLE